MSNLTQDDYDKLVYPGFLRRNVAKWNEDGSFAPVARAKTSRGDQFVLQLKSGEVDQDIAEIEQELGLNKKNYAAGSSGRQR
jgi:hypothetical protein